MLVVQAKNQALTFESEMCILKKIQFELKNEVIKMTVIDTVAKDLRMKPNDLLKESLNTYLEQRLSKIEAELYLIAKR